MKQAGLLDKIDNYFEKQPRTTFLGCIFLVVVVIGYLVYDYTFESSEEYLNEQIETRTNAENKLRELENYIQTQQSSGTIARLNTQLTNGRATLEDVNKDNEYFDNKLREVSRILYNQKNWSNFIAKINKLSLDNKLTISELKSKRNDQAMQQVQEAFDVEFNASGKYQNILQMINELEKSHDVVDVKSLTLEKKLDEVPGPNSNPAPVLPSNASKATSTNDVQAHLVISIWGLKY